jgi:hypothetical protein
VIPDVASDGVLQFGHGLEDAAPDAPAGYHGEEAFDGVEPGSGGRGKVEDPSRMIGQPRLDLGVLVGCVVIEEALVGFRGDGERAGSEPLTRGGISACWS